MSRASQKNRLIRSLRTVKARTLLAEAQRGIYTCGRLMLVDCLRNGMLTSHYRGVSCLVFSDDGTLLISGSEDGGIRIWSLIGLFDDNQSQQESNLCMHSFTEHTLFNGCCRRIWWMQNHYRVSISGSHVSSIFLRNILKTSNKSGALCIILNTHTHTQLMCLCPDDLHSARKQRKRRFR